MIVIPDKCEKCGTITIPTEVTCDTCGRTHVIETFEGIVLEFNDDDDKDAIDEIFTTDEYHFCDAKCVAEFLTDSNHQDMLAKFSDKPMSIYVEPAHVDVILYALGRCVES